MTIYKYPLSEISSALVFMPANAVILHAGVQQDTVITLWAQVDEDETNTVARHIEVFGTGQPMSEHNRVYIGTVFTHHKKLVWHIFERTDV